jgi:hypothetical protein
LPDEELERLSAYLDGRLPREEAVRLEARLETEKDLRRVLDELRQTVRLLHSLPQVKAPRNFTLGPQAAGKPARGWQYPLLQLGTAVATLAFLVVTGFGLLLMGGGMAAAPAMSLARDMVQETAPPPAEQPLMESAGEAALSAETPAEPAAPGAMFLEAGTPTLAATTTPGWATPAAACDECAARMATEASSLPLEEAPPPTRPPAPSCAECGPEPTAAADVFGDQELKAAPTVETPAIVGLYQREAQSPWRSPIVWWFALDIVLGLAAVVLAIFTIRMRRRSR